MPPAPGRSPGHPLGQRSFDDSGTPLAQVTFVVLDTETTGAAPPAAALTEVGAVKLQGGECLGTFATLVNPGLPVPPAITYLTGITQAMVAPAPSEEVAVPLLVDFAGSAVLVGHNLAFDLRFIDAVRLRRGEAKLGNLRVDTAALARRLLAGEVRDYRLHTLARHLRLDHQPSHRALDDALATADLLHRLLERSAGWGAMGLAELLDLPRLASHPQAPKLRLTTGLPRRPGVYVFRDGAGAVCYAGKATDLRARVRSYFSGDDRRKVTPCCESFRR